jgi:hypothetical protein
LDVAENSITVTPLRVFEKQIETALDVAMSGPYRPSVLQVFLRDFFVAFCPRTIELLQKTGLWDTPISAREVGEVLSDWVSINLNLMRGPMVGAFAYTELLPAIRELSTELDHVLDDEKAIERWLESYPGEALSYDALVQVAAFVLRVAKKLTDDAFVIRKEEESS